GDRRLERPESVGTGRSRLGSGEHCSREVGDDNLERLVDRARDAELAAVVSLPGERDANACLRLHEDVLERRPGARASVLVADRESAGGPAHVDPAGPEAPSDVDECRTVLALES